MYFKYHAFESTLYNIFFNFCMLKSITANMNGSTIAIARNATTNGNAALHQLNGTYTNGTSAKSMLNGIGKTAHLPVSNASTTSTARDVQSKNAQLAAKIIQQSNIICFDVDSTVIEEEGIDELARFCGKGEEVARVTKEAMGGAMTFQDALAIRLNIIRPTQKQISDFIKLQPSTLTRNVKAFIERLRADGKQVYLISGGFQSLIAPVAHEVGVPLDNMYANKLLFSYNGEYAAFDDKQPTSKSGGKAEAISIIKQRHPDALITMIGDGATDLEAVPPANYFIGFGGNVVRPEVYKRAQYYVTDFEQLMPASCH